jgi:hypothetical protein
MADSRTEEWVEAVIARQWHSTHVSVEILDTASSTVATILLYNSHEENIPYLNWQE